MTNLQVSSTKAKIEAAAIKYGLDPSLALAVAKQESNFDQSARSSAGAVGVMQLMGPTAGDLGVDRYDEDENIDGGVRYLAQQFRRFGGDVEKTLAAYNFGPNAVAKGWKWPAETVNYVSKVLGFRLAFAPIDGEESAGSDSLPAAAGSKTLVVMAAFLSVGAAFAYSVA